jgi:hypothetical protein
MSSPLPSSIEPTPGSALQKFKIIELYLENRTGIGVFPAPLADELYTTLRKRVPEIGPTTDYISLHITEVQEGHDIYVIPLKENSEPYTTSLSELSAKGESPLDIAELGRDYNYGEYPENIFIKIDTSLDGFLVLDSFCGTNLEPIEWAEEEAVVY